MSDENPQESLKKSHPLSILEAVDYLCYLTELSEMPSQLPSINQKKISQAFETLNSYLHHLYQKERGELTELSTQIGIQAMMQLAQEAAKKVEKFAAVFQKEGRETEYQKLEQFYLSKIVTKLRKNEEPAHLSKTEDVLAHTSEIEIEKQTLKDLDTVRLDQEYELFYIHKEDGMPFFNESLARHIRLVGRFDKSVHIEEGEDLLKRMTLTLDRDYHTSAREILSRASDHLTDFYKQALKYKHTGIVAALNKAFMALLLAANPKNLAHNTNSGKYCLHYFIDFQRYLREALTSDEYFQLLYVELKQETPFFIYTKKLSQLLCHLLILRVGSQQESLELIKCLFKKEEVKFSSFWATLLAIDQLIRQELARYPNGPLLEILNVLDEKKHDEGFDPILQTNAPYQLFSISSEMIHTTFIHLPSPTHQELVDKAYINPEFTGYLHYLDEKKHLLINLQDLTSWKEVARFQELEQLSKETKFEKSLQVVGFAKDTDFYRQESHYQEISQAANFKDLLKEQVMGGKQCGFYFPKESGLIEAIFPFIDFIHQYFYDHKEMLTKKERQDFIEIFYFFACLLIIEKTAPDAVSFTCKDAIDSGSCSAAAFFGFAKILSSSSTWTDHEKDFFLFAFYKPAAFVRHRAPFAHRVQRTLAALEYFETVFKSKRDEILKACATLFPDLPLHKFVINKVA